MRSSLVDLGRAVAALRWSDLTAKGQAKLPELVLDACACALSSRSIDPHPGFVDQTLGVEGDAVVWFRSRRTDIAHAALVNGTLAHHEDWDDGVSGLHGGVTVVPAAVAVAETVGASGRDCLTAIAAGYAAGVACGRSLLEGIDAHRLHPPAMLGALGAAAATSRLLGATGQDVARTIALAGTLMPLAPFENFSQGASAKDLYGGWPAYVGVQAALLVREGIAGPVEILDVERDGLPAFLHHDHGPSPTRELDVDVLHDVYIKPWPSCRSTHAVMTALEKLLPLDANEIASIAVETYPFAARLSLDSAHGARTSIPWAVESMLEGHVRELVTVQETSDVADNGARVRVTFRDGRELTAETNAPRSETRARAKLHRIAGRNARAIERAVDGLESEDSIESLLDVLRG